MLLCVGDSITAEPGGWPSLLGVPVDVRAVEGARWHDVLDQLAGVGRVDVVVASVGTNDALALGLPVEAGGFRAVAERMAFVGVRVAMLDVVLFAPTWPLALPGRRRAVRAAVRAAGCDVIRPVLPPWCWRRDRIHPNGRGQARIARAVTGWLEAEQVVP